MLCNMMLNKHFIAVEAQVKPITMMALLHLGVPVSHVIKPTCTIPERQNFKSKTGKVIRHTSVIQSSNRQYKVLEENWHTGAAYETLSDRVIWPNEEHLKHEHVRCNLTFPCNIDILLHPQISHTSHVCSTYLQPLCLAWLWPSHLHKLCASGS